MAEIVVGKSLGLSITFRNQDGNPMSVTPVPDAPPVWSNTTPATETLTPAADGLTCVANSVGVGSDTISLALDVGGVAFAATLDVLVQPVPEVLTSVTIEATPL